MKLKFAHLALSACLVAFAAPKIRAQDPISIAPVAPEAPIVGEPQGLGELELVAVDIARRAVLAYYPGAGHYPIRTLEVRVRPEGDSVHTFARLQWMVAPLSRKFRLRSPFQANTPPLHKHHESEVFASLVYTPETRRLFDISYKDNHLTPHRTVNRRIDLLSKINEDLERRDPTRMPAPLVGRRLDLLPPRNAPWYWSIFGGDHAWHANAADSHIRHRWIPFELSPAAPQ